MRNGSYHAYEFPFGEGDYTTVCHFRTPAEKKKEKADRAKRKRPNPGHLHHLHRKKEKTAIPGTPSRRLHPGKKKKERKGQNIPAKKTGTPAPTRFRPHDRKERGAK